MALPKKKLSLGEYQKGVFRRLNEYRRMNRLCDVTVLVQGRQFPSHRAVLAASGGFFEGLFAANMKEQSEKTVELSAVDPDVAEDILSFMYTGEIDLTPENAQAVVVAADFLLLDELKKEVDAFMSQNALEISPDILSTYLFALRYKCEMLKTAAFKEVCEKFELIVSDSDEFLELSHETLQEIIASNDVVVSSEEVVFEAVVEWTKHADDRRSAFNQLFSCIRLCSFTEEYLQNTVIAEGLVSTDHDCLRSVVQRMRTRYAPTAANWQHPRSCLDLYTNAILVFPKVKASEVAKGPWCYVPFNNKWYHIPIDDNRNDYGYGIMPVYHDGAILLVKYTYSNDIIIDRYDLKTNSWSQLTSLEHPYSQFGVACLQGTIYLVGGVNKQESNTSTAAVYAFDITVKPKSELSPVAVLNVSRRLPCVVANEKYIYALGGVGDGPINNITLNSVERYDPHANIWEQMSPMKSMAGLNAHATIAGDKIFICSGQQTNSLVPEFNEMYDIPSNTWFQIPKSPHHTTIARGVLAQCDDHLYLIGCTSMLNVQASGSGCTSQSNLTAFGGFRFSSSSSICSTILYVSSYNIKANSWSSVFTTPLKATYKVPNQLSLSGIAVRLPKQNLSGLAELKMQIHEGL